MQKACTKKIFELYLITDSYDMLKYQKFNTMSKNLQNLFRF